MPDKTSPILDQFVADVVNRKRKPAEAPKTPQDARNGLDGTETPGAVVSGSVAGSRDALLDYLTQIEESVRHARYVLELLFSPLRLPEQVTPESVETARRKAEAEADQRAFERQQKELAEKAQVAAYEPDLWICPEHGKSVRRKSPKGREFLACSVEGCGEFERVRA